jgi:hypothetical protein
VRRIPPFLRTRYATWLAGIRHLSVREQSGAALVAELTGRTVPVVADPTVLVDRTIWDRFIPDASPPRPQPYVARFFFSPPTTAQESWIRSRVAGAETHAIGSGPRSDEFAGPAAFIAMIARADLVVTDSFHAAAFALLYGRPIVVRDRFQGDDRIATLLRCHGIAARRTGVRGLTVVDHVDWAAVESEREKLRARSWDFLAAALRDGP